MNKIIKHIMTIWIIVWITGVFCMCEWQRYSFWWTSLSTDMPYIQDAELPTCDSTNIWDCVSIKEETKEDSIIIRLLWVFGLDTDRNNDHKFLDYARAIINMALWLVALIALIMTIYTFYMMFFTENEAWIKKAKWNLVGIFIALGILWLAWIIVSFIFRWYQSNWKWRENDIQSNNIVVTYSNTKQNNNQIYLTI